MKRKANFGDDDADTTVKVDLGTSFSTILFALQNIYDVDLADSFWTTTCVEFKLMQTAPFCVSSCLMPLLVWRLHRKLSENVWRRSLADA
jgi:hypothetical protein